MSGPQFVVIAGPDKDKTFAVRPGAGHLLGRHQDAAYRVTDPRASRAHAEVQSDGRAVTVVDRGGSGGTLVNGAKVAAKVLDHGDTVQVGDTLLRFLAGAPAQAETVRGLSTPAEYDAAATDQLAELSGRTLAHYKLGAVLGKGSTGMVFRAEDAQDGKAVALKVMQPAYAKNDDDMQRFVRAMKAMLPLDHPNLVRVYAAGRSGPYCWSAMELVDGEALTGVIRRIGAAGMLDWKYAFRVGVQVGRALGYAHARGVVHRDVSPANVLIRSNDKAAKLADLMLARALEGGAAQQVTRPGELVGDVNYMAPERTAGGAEVDARSDLWSLGATCYALLTGTPPFAGAGLVDTIAKIRAAEPARPGTFQMGIPASFEGAVLKLLSKRPADRYQSADELVAELERVGRANGAQVS